MSSNGSNKSPPDAGEATVAAPSPEKAAAPNTGETLVGEFPAPKPTATKPPPLPKSLLMPPAPLKPAQVELKDQEPSLPNGESLAMSDVSLIENSDSAMRPDLRYRSATQAAVDTIKSIVKSPVKLLIAICIAAAVVVLSSVIADLIMGEATPVIEVPVVELTPVAPVAMVPPPTPSPAPEPIPVPAATTEAPANDATRDAIARATQLAANEPAVDNTATAPEAKPAATPEAKPVVAASTRKAERAALVRAHAARKYAEAYDLGIKYEAAYANELDWEIQYFIADSARRLKKAPEAISRLAAFATKYPGNIYADDAQYWRGMLLIASGQAEEGRKVLMGVAADAKSNFKKPAKVVLDGKKARTPKAAVDSTEEPALEVPKIEPPSTVPAPAAPTASEPEPVPPVVEPPPAVEPTPAPETKP